MLVINPLGHFCQVQQKNQDTHWPSCCYKNHLNCPTIMKYLTSLIAQMFPVQRAVRVNYLAKRYFVVRVVFVALFVVTVAFRFRIVLSRTSVLQWQWIWVYLSVRT